MYHHILNHQQSSKFLFHASCLHNINLHILLHQANSLFLCHVIYHFPTRNSNLIILLLHTSLHLHEYKFLYHLLYHFSILHHIHRHQHELIYPKINIYLLLFLMIYLPPILLRKLNHLAIFIFHIHLSFHFSTLLHRQHQILVI